MDLWDDDFELEDYKMKPWEIIMEDGNYAIDEKVRAEYMEEEGE